MADSPGPVKTYRTEILLANAGHFCAGSRRRIRIAVRSLPIGGHRWHRRHRCPNPPRSSGISGHDCSCPKPPAPRHSASGPKPSAPGRRADDLCPTPLSFRHTRSPRNDRPLRGYRFRSWRTSSTCMCGLCERPPMMGARPSAPAETSATRLVARGRAGGVGGLIYDLLSRNKR